MDLFSITVVTGYLLGWCLTYIWLVFSALQNGDNPDNQQLEFLIIAMLWVVGLIPLIFAIISHVLTWAGKKLKDKYEVSQLLSTVNKESE